MNRREIIKFSLMLTGTAMTSSVAKAVLAEVSADTAHTAAGFPDAQRKVVSLLAEMIIPETDTPGAIEAGVPQFIETIVYEWYTDREQKIFLGGLAELDAICQQDGAKSFAHADGELRNKALKAMENAASGFQAAANPLAALLGGGDDEGAPFFSKLKQLTVLGYYTSEVGAKTELAYNPVPGRYEGDYPLEKVGRHWTR